MSQEMGLGTLIPNITNKTEFGSFRSLTYRLESHVRLQHDGLIIFRIATFLQVRSSYCFPK